MDRYLSTGDHALTGDRQAGALVTTDGTVEWFCCPRFDSPSVVAFAGHARASIQRAAGTRGQDRFDHRSGAGYSGRSAAGLRPARIGL